MFFKSLKVIFGKFHKLKTSAAPNISKSNMRLVWVGGYPAHYMGDFHRRLESVYDKVCFLYKPFKFRGNAYAHELVQLPLQHKVLPKKNDFLFVWRQLDHLSASAILIAGNYPRSNLVAAIWAIVKGRHLYYLADSNPLDSRHKMRRFINEFMLRILLRNTTKILSIGSRNTEFYSEYFDEDGLRKRLIKFPLPHIADHFEKITREETEHFSFLYVGRLDEVKSVGNIVAAFALFSRSEKCRSRLIIAGDGPDKSIIEAQVEKLNLREQVKFLGSVPSGNVPDVYKSANVLVIASKDEPWGLVVNEALSAGIPVIGPFWIGSFLDLIKSGDTGIAIPDNSPEQLALAMRFFLENPDEAKRMGLEGRRLVREQEWTIDGSVKAFGRLPALKR